MRDMGITSNEEAKKSGWKIVVPFPGEIVGKATFEDDFTRIMKSTKRFRVEGGWIYNTSTEVRERGEAAIQQVSIAEALVFVPDSR